MSDNKFQTIFDKEYARLNDEQRQAVDTLDGPVMVIAGAGTGKTQTIALRIANILEKTDTNPQSILCLTFTDSAAITMRSRLTQIIGPTAYSVHISTFHAFCQETIQSNPEYFIFAPNIKPLDDLDRFKITQEIIDELPDQSLLKPWGDHYFYQNELITTIQKLKRENCTPDAFEKLLQDEALFISKTTPIFEALKALRLSKTLESEIKTLEAELQKALKDLPHYRSLFTYESEAFKSGVYDQGAAKSALINYKNALIKHFDYFGSALPKQQELLTLYRSYQKKLIKHSRFDYDDMIIFVLNAFATHPDLLLNYQEKYQHILVDEYQDTNTGQNQILEYLGAYFDNPNLFVVGDDDQSVYRFQGAAIENIFNFYQKYRSQLKLIVLKNNYRSHQLILDSSLSVINNNKNRIANYIASVDKSLVATSLYDPDPINIYEAATPLDENYFVAKQIQKLLVSGVPPKEIAVLYRNNADSLDLEEMLSSLKIKYLIPSGQNALSDSLVLQTIDLLKLINNPSAELVFRFLTFPFVNFSQLDLFKITRWASKNKQNILDLLFDKTKLQQLSEIVTPKSQVKLRNLSRRLAKARQWQQIYSLDTFFNQVIRSFHLLDYLLQKNDLEHLAIFNCFYREVKRLSQEELASNSELLQRLDLHIQNHIPLNVSSLDSNQNDAIRLFTVHKAKGMEFDHVFIIKCLDKKWGNHNLPPLLRLPLGILKTEVASQTAAEFEDERRLFYVALTRAKKQIYISFAKTNNQNKAVLPSLFIFEIKPELLEHLPSDLQSSNALKVIMPKQLFNPQKNIDYQQYLRDYLKNEYVFNISHLNAYLRCPCCFYYQTILRLPSAKDKFASLGTAVHGALSSNFKSKEDLLTAFAYDLKKEQLSAQDFDESLTKGNLALSKYFDNYLPVVVDKKCIDIDFASHHVVVDDIRITGKIDKIEFLDQHGNARPAIRVVDYKTGNPDSKFQELSLEGDYFRQLVFYKLLADSDPFFSYDVIQGVIDFIEPSSRTQKFVRKTYELTTRDVDNLKILVDDVYQKILRLEFDPSASCPDRNHLHQLSK